MRKRLIFFDVGHVYLIHTSEHIKENRPIYKIGRTDDIRSRMNSYPKDSHLIFIRKVANSVEVEGDLIKHFKNKYIWENSYGNEYFRGDCDDMANDMSIYIINSMKTNKGNTKKQLSELTNGNSERKIPDCNKVHDIYSFYIKDRLESVPNGKLLTKYIYQDFKVWFSTEYPHDTIPSCSVFKKGLSDHINIYKCIRVGKENQQGIKGFRIK